MFVNPSPRAGLRLYSCCGVSGEGQALVFTARARACVLRWAGRYLPCPGSLAVTDAAKTVPVHLFHGGADPLVVPMFATQSKAALDAMGFRVRRRLNTGAARGSK